MDLDWLETFLAVVDRGGFTAAAAHVHRSQSRVSAHIANLEKELGVRLIDRSRRPATLTAAGRVFAGHARGVTADLEASRLALEQLALLNRDAVSVVTTSSVAPATLPHLLPAIRREHPGVTVSVTELGSPVPVDRLTERQFTIGLLPALGAALPTGLVEHVLWRTGWQLLVPADHDLASLRRPLTWDDFASTELIVGDGVAQVVAHRRSGLPESAVPVAWVDAVGTIPELVRRGVGLGLDTAVALAGVDTSGLALVDIGETDAVGEVGAYWFDWLPTTQLGWLLQKLVLTLPLPPAGQPAVGRRDHGAGGKPLGGAPRGYGPRDLFADRSP